MTEKNHLKFMQFALEQAALGRGQTFPNPMVGAVIVKANKVIATGFHKVCGGEHAEAIALKKAGSKARGATLYVTLEPCFHHGRTPPCVEAVLRSGVKEVVIAMTDPNPLTKGKSIRLLKKQGLKVVTGILKDEAEKLNEAFIKSIVKKIPFAVAKSAQTLDGKIATRRNDSKWITSKKTREYARKRRDEFDAIMVGSNTVAVDDPGLNGHASLPVKIVVDTTLKIKPTAKLLKMGSVIIATTLQASKSKISLLRKRGIHILVCPLKQERINLKHLFKELAKIEIRCILVEGGATLIGALLREDLIDKMQIYIAPKILGDCRAKGSVNGFKLNKISQSLQLKDVSFNCLGEDYLVEGYVYRNR